MPDTPVEFSMLEVEHMWDLANGYVPHPDRSPRTQIASNPTDDPELQGRIKEWKKQL